MQLLTELHYHPSIVWFQKAVQADEILLESQEHYQKQSYRNRCHILTAQGVLPLTVPVKNGNKKIKALDVEIEYDQRWVDVHWRTIRSAYGNAPFFEFYADYIQAVYERKPSHLFQLNLELLRLYLKFLKLKTPVRLTESYETTYPAPVLDLRNVLHPKREPDNLDIKKYAQVFGKQFAPNLSILDLLFNLGPEASLYLQNQ
ncbi:WbqC-like family protein [Rufibacter sp. DG15C]|uniref:WbqC family protein n=1 Tax=Rufibacter sp. DG15C TaxID=1379909 RepID=UPI00078DE87C|nr:WbqC family protein [Rufibacter sp. DG15C]AMM52686.1 WbqC-like family protein [Rufibacter sp. DG15C]